MENLKLQILYYKITDVFTLGQDQDMTQGQFFSELKFV